jgi:hypothetical protein
MTEVKGATTTVIQIDAAQFDQLLSEFRDLKSEVRELRAEVEHLHTYPHLGPWLTAKEALQLLPIDDNRTLSKWVKRGIIESKVIAENGNKRSYRKADVLKAAEVAEKRLQGY